MESKNDQKPLDLFEFENIAIKILGLTSYDFWTMPVDEMVCLIYHRRQEQINKKDSPLTMKELEELKENLGG